MSNRGLTFLTLLVCGGLVLVAWGPRGRNAANAHPPVQEATTDYLGQARPGTIPVPFAHEILTRELHSSPVFSPGDDEIYWSEMEGGDIHFMRVEDGVWSTPRVAPFSLPYSGEPEFGRHDGALYFLSGHRFEGSQGEYDENVWKVVRTPEGWSPPEPLGPPVNDHPMHWGVSFADNGNLYFGHRGGRRCLLL